MLTRKRKSISDDKKSTPRTLIEAFTDTQGILSTVRRKSPRLQQKQLLVSKSRKSIGRSPKQSSVVTPRSQLEYLSNFGVMVTAAKPEKHHKRLPSPQTVQVSRTSSPSKSNNPETSKETSELNLQLQESNSFQHQSAQEDVSIAKTKVLVVVDESPSHSNESPSHNNPQEASSTSETDGTGDGTERQQTYNSRSNSVSRQSSVTNTPNTVVSTPERWERRSINLQKILKPIFNPESLGEELYEKIAYLKKQKRKSDKPIPVILSDSDDAASDDSYNENITLEVVEKSNTELEPNPSTSAGVRDAEQDMNDLVSQSTSSEADLVIVESSTNSTSRAGSIGKSSVVLDSSLSPIEEVPPATPIDPEENTDERNSELPSRSYSSVSSSTPKQNENDETPQKSVTSSVEIEIIPASEKESPDGATSPLQLSSSFLNVNEAEMIDEQDESENAVKKNDTSIEDVDVDSDENQEPASSPITKKLPSPTAKKLTPKKKAPTLRSLNPVKRSPMKSKKQSLIPRSQLKGILEHYSSLKFTKEAVDEAEDTFSKFFEQLNHDMAATSEFAGRNIIQKSDLELIMKRQRFVTKERPLHILIEEMLPMEYREKLLPCAASVLQKLK